MKFVLLVEDDIERVRQIQACMPQGVRCVWAQTAGAASGTLRLDKFAAVLLDYDLYGGSLGGPRFAGETVAGAICETQDRDCRIFVHSQNTFGGRRLVELLTQAGFSVDHHPWCEETKPVLATWLREIGE